MDSFKTSSSTDVIIKTPYYSSPAKKYKLILQTDGNLVIYNYTVIGDITGAVMWYPALGTAGKTLYLTPDGNIPILI